LTETSTSEHVVSQIQSQLLPFFGQVPLFGDEFSGSLDQELDVGKADCAWMPEFIGISSVSPGRMGMVVGDGFEPSKA
jgi:hypothetical protein